MPLNGKTNHNQKENIQKDYRVVIERKNLTMEEKAIGCCGSSSL
jgi:hypothetical protein